MKDELLEQLKKNYPRACNFDNCIGFVIGDGWYKIVDKMFCNIEKEIIKYDIKDFKILQIKEKFGQLRVYNSHSGDESNIDKYISDAEHESFFICEDCGAPGKIGGKGWIRTLCDDCRI